MPSPASQAPRHDCSTNRQAAAREFQRSIDEGIGESSSVFHLATIREAEGNKKDAEELLKHARQFKDAHSSSS